MILCRKYHQPVFDIKVNCFVLFFGILFSDTHLYTNCVGPIPAVNEVLKAPSAW